MSTPPSGDLQAGAADGGRNFGRQWKLTLTSMHVERD
jgi:hypothetical protein